MNETKCRAIVKERSMGGCEIWIRGRRCLLEDDGTVVVSLARCRRRFPESSSRARWSRE